ncbi:hypothetical protein QJS04_geneDACA012846 [Acorus gramineus]|uniref:Uncharacterized protein n=1 Tax=Acorus gramineus TaxID=55184 RepID=A0AAV9BHG3_ACOGR|nr:hypothetical protein QJS04_geneDACA012846 [Acorus gramineus]
MGLKAANLTPTKDPLVTYNGAQVVPAGRITLPVRAGNRTTMTEFIIMHHLSPYNAIIGRTWLAAMKAIPSTYDQRLRFPTAEGIMEIREDQVAAKRCYMAAMVGKSAILDFEEQPEDREIHPKMKQLLQNRDKADERRPGPEDRSLKTSRMSQ